ncbi:MAG TPA: sensor histidine kinase [Ruminococcaceae bacterium]|nr:sensor histidine kinase [Oscillospiraceae bacterium]
MKKDRQTLGLSSLTIISIVVATALTVTFSIVIFASVYSNALSDNAVVNADQTVKQAAVAVDNALDSMRSQLEEISRLIGENGEETTLKSLIDTLVSVRKDILAVTVYGENGEIVFCAGGEYPLKEKIYKDLSFDKALFDASPEFSVSAPHVQSIFEGNYPWVVTVAKRTEEAVVGNGRYVTVDFSFNPLAEYIDRVGVGQHGYCYIADEYGHVIYHPQQQVIFSGIKSENETLVAGIKQGTERENGKITAVCPTSDERWKIVGISYTDELERERSTQIFFSILATVCCCAVVAVLVLQVYQRVFNTPVRQLVKAMKIFEDRADSFVYTPQPQMVTELGELNDSFAHMVHRIQELVEQVRAEETQLRKTELKALQAQINPHFLYNTLDSIQWMCERGKTEQAAAMVSALAKLFRISISRGHELIPIKDEVQHAKSYLIIQSYRYRNQFSYHFEVEEGLEDFLCNKITIQPLIENAIYHGINRMVDEGEITVCVKTAEDCPQDILITVEDNGVGMTQEQCRKILEKGRSDSGGIGVKNVNDRLKIYFGEAYGIEIHSEPDVGTKVVVRIPKIEKEAEA